MGKKLPKPPPGIEDEPLPDEMLRQMRPASEVTPDIVEAYERGELQNNPPRRFRGPQKEATKVQTTLRIDADVIEHFKEGGSGWQTRLNDTLRDSVFGHKEAS